MGKAKESVQILQKGMESLFVSVLNRYPACDSRNFVCRVKKRPFVSALLSWHNNSRDFMVPPTTANHYKLQTFRFSLRKFPTIPQTKFSRVALLYCRQML